MKCTCSTTSDSGLPIERPRRIGDRQHDGGRDQPIARRTGDRESRANAVAMAISSGQADSDADDGHEMGGEGWRSQRRASPMKGAESDQQGGRDYGNDEARGLEPRPGLRLCPDMLAGGVRLSALLDEAGERDVEHARLLLRRCHCTRIGLW